MNEMNEYVEPFSCHTSVLRTDGRTDRRTDRIGISISRVSSRMLTRDKNGDTCSAINIESADRSTAMMRARDTDPSDMPGWHVFVSTHVSSNNAVDNAGHVTDKLSYDTVVWRAQPAVWRTARSAVYAVINRLSSLLAVTSMRAEVSRFTHFALIV